ncbi:hypothetical protein FHS82_001157 [Pseudochelatococcus lubricantis]|uniref:Uncharacterized protein n=1 Tax=Pseudochelatococcus lubricantis TaxID=1538102 RepID=A0ABX0UWL1_9HYPH|nr:hypothetical protein [Pseudochelatococcus lubricantis]NIJ57331.1 hypothetical protein [Pseudochelatococcus lubricantis]
MQHEEDAQHGENANSSDHGLHDRNPFRIQGRFGAPNISGASKMPVAPKFIGVHGFHSAADCGENRRRMRQQSCLFADGKSTVAAMQHERRTERNETEYSR